MSKDEVTKKLAACEASLKRWQSRLTRAVNAINKLQKQRRRLLLAKPLTAKSVIAAKAEFVQAVDDQLTNVIEGKPVDMGKLDDLAVPAFLNRADPLIAERMTAARKKAEAEARHKMPLTGKAAIDYLKVTPKKKKTTAAK